MIEKYKVTLAYYQQSDTHFDARHVPDIGKQSSENDFKILAILWNVWSLFQEYSSLFRKFFVEPKVFNYVYFFLETRVQNMFCRSHTKINGSGSSFQNPKSPENDSYLGNEFFFHHHHHRFFLKSAFSLVKSRLALGSTGCFVIVCGLATMPKMAKYTGRWL